MWVSSIPAWLSRYEQQRNSENAREDPRSGRLSSSFQPRGDPEQFLGLVLSFPHIHHPRSKYLWNYTQPSAIHRNLWRRMTLELYRSSPLSSRQRFRALEVLSNPIDGSFEVCSHQGPAEDRAWVVEMVGRQNMGDGSLTRKTFAQ
jgi:hypothetical protein